MTNNYVLFQLNFAVRSNFTSVIPFFSLSFYYSGIFYLFRNGEVRNCAKRRQQSMKILGILNLGGF